jgi:hypothetical protein
MRIMEEMFDVCSKIQKKGEEDRSRNGKGFLGN